MNALEFLSHLATRDGLGRPAGAIGHRLRVLVEGVSLPFALQGLYVIGYRFASGLGTGKPTTFSYAYLIASLLVGVTATSIALVSSVPPAPRADAGACLTPRRGGVVGVAAIAAAAGVFAVAGGPGRAGALGSSYGGGDRHRARPPRRLPVAGWSSVAPSVTFHSCSSRGPLAARARGWRPRVPRAGAMVGGSRWQAFRDRPRPYGHGGCRVPARSARSSASLDILSPRRHCPFSSSPSAS